MRFRHEMKYIVHLQDAEALVKDLEPFCSYDKHTDATNSYEIASVYYDTDDLRFYLDREESVGYRRKIRLRTYNKDAEAKALFIEIKEKHKAYVAKKRINLKNMDVLDLGIPHNKIPLDLVIANFEDTAEAREIEYLHSRLRMYPVVLIRYIRKPLIPNSESDMRITIDTKITAGGTSLPVYDKDEEKFICPPDKAVLEVKTNQSIPLWLQSIMRKYDFKHTKFSKYCLGVDAVYGTKNPWTAFQENMGDYSPNQENISAESAKNSSDQKLTSAQSRG